MTPRHVEALENEDYSYFPGETYTVGFLKNYSEFLNLDTDHILTLFRGVQIDQSQAPISELTEVTRPAFSMELPGMRFWLTLGAVLFAGLIILLLVTGRIGIPGSSGADSVCAAGNMQSVILPLPDNPALQENLTAGTTLRFAIDRQSVQLCLINVDRSDPARPQGTFEVVSQGSRPYRFQAEVGETVILSSSVPGFEDLNRDISLTPDSFSDGAQVLIGSGIRDRQMAITDPGAADATTVTGNESETEGTATRGEDPPAQESDSTAGIAVTLEFIEDSFIEWTSDGNYNRGVQIRAGNMQTFEAEERLEIKIGNAGGVRVMREGASPRIAGPAGRIARLTYRYVPDPLDPARRQIEESIEVAR